MPIRPGLPTWLENGRALICPGRRPPLAAADSQPQPEPSAALPLPRSLDDLPLPGPGETMLPEVIIELMIREEYGILQDYLDRVLSEL